jgi:hypothetical protein
MTEHIALRFDWDDVADQIVTAVLGLNGMAMDDGSARWDAVAICIDQMAVMLTVEPDTDQIMVSHEAPPSGDEWKRISSFDFADGKPLGWCWIGINSQGYKDSFTIALGDVVPDAIRPRFVFLAEASGLCCLDLVQRQA